MVLSIFGLFLITSCKCTDKANGKRTELYFGLSNESGVIADSSWVEL